MDINMAVSKIFLCLPRILAEMIQFGLAHVCCLHGWFNQQLGGGFKYVLFSPLLGEDSHFDEYVSNGLKPPPRQLLKPPPNSVPMVFIVFSRDSWG